MLLLIRYRFENDSKLRNHVMYCSGVKDAEYRIDGLLYDYESEELAINPKRQELGDLYVDSAYFIEEDALLPETWNRN